jgi:hypothetical protein
MNGDKTVQAVFGTPLVTAVTGLGSVSAQPALAAYPYGSVARLTAVPQAGNYFVLWGQPASGHQNPVNVVVTNPNPEVSALFTTQGPQQASLTVSWQGAGQVQVSPNANVFARGANVMLTAEAEPGQVFLGWEGDLAGAVNPAVVTLTKDTVIQARFSARPVLSAPAGLAGMKPEGFRLMLTAGELARGYRIEGSADLQVWQPIGWVTNTFGTAQFLDTAPGTNRAYRAAY